MRKSLVRPRDLGLVCLFLFAAAGASPGQSVLFTMDELVGTELSGASDSIFSKVGRAGDVDGLGQDDLLYTFSGGFFGIPGIRVVSSESFETIWSFDFSRIAAEAYSVDGDLDITGDGVPDVISAEVGDSALGFLGNSIRIHDGTNGTEFVSVAGDDVSDGFGFSVANAGDVNGDGIVDVIAGAPQGSPLYPTTRGYARVLSGEWLRNHAGTPATPQTLFTFVGPESGGQYGHSVSGAGDVNNDGFADLIIGAHLAEAGGAYSGYAEVRSGADGTLLFSINGSAGEWFGFSVSGAGDVNNDGFDDVIVGGPNRIGLDPGVARVYAGPNGDLLYTHSGSAGDQLGYSVSGAGDLNHDGFADYVAGAPGRNLPGFPGSVHVFSGRDGQPLTVIDGARPNEAFGASVSDAGNINGDACPDIIVSTAPYTASFVPGIVARVYVVSGAACSDEPPPPSENTAPACELITASTTPLPGGERSVPPGETLTVTLRGTDGDVGDVLTVSGTGLPVGATLTPASGSSGSSPLEVMFSWTPTAGGIDSTVTISFTDTGELGAMCSFDVRSNTPPDADAGMNVTAECMEGGAVVTLDATASMDPDGDPLTYQWAVSDLSVALDDSTSPTPSGTFGLGVTMATVTVDDGRGAVDTADVLITVLDTLPPIVQCTTDVAMLWPANHNMVPVQVFVTATDLCGLGSADVQPVMVTLRSDEADDEAGNGSTSGDANGADGFTSPVEITGNFVFDSEAGTSGAWCATVMLRAERSGGGDGRSYTFDVVATDPFGNQGITSCVVVVPHDRSGKKKKE